MNIPKQVFVSAYSWRDDKIEELYKKTQQEILREADTDIYLRNLSPIF